MAANERDPIRRPSAMGVAVVCGFGGTVAMWAVAYLSHLPAAAVPSGVSIIALGICVTAAGLIAGRHAPRPVPAGLLTGLVSAGLNLLIVGSLLGGEAPNRLRDTAPCWALGLFGFSAVTGVAGALAGARGAGARPQPDWTGAFAAIAATAGLLMVSIGGVVTSYGAGLAVVDWPNTFGYSMFLYPLSRMTGGIYFEHAHRLFGTLLGLTTLAMSMHVWRADKRPRVRALLIGALSLVVIQAIFGGLRVTGRFTLSTDPAVMDPSIVLALVHGVAGQAVVALLTAVAVVTSRAWRDAGPGRASSAAHAARGLALAALAAMGVQLVLGAALRHLGAAPLLHIASGVIVLLILVAAGVRAWGLPEAPCLLQRAGLAVAFLAGVQFWLGFGAFVATGAFMAHQNRAPLEVLLTTLHQTLGAILLASAVCLALFTFRLITPPERAD